MNNDLTAFEKIPVKIFNTSEQGSVFVAKEIAALIKLRQKENKPVVLGLATGSTPTRLYAELVKKFDTGIAASLMTTQIETEIHSMKLTKNFNKTLPAS